jgi:phosphinothricin acetyltransferase
MIVVEEGGDVVTFAATSEYSSRGYYTGVSEFSAHADRGARGRDAGGMTMAVLILAAEQAGFWKLLSRIFVRTFSTPPGTGTRRWSSS